MAKKKSKQPVKPTDEQVEKEIATLIAMKPKLKRGNVFGDNHHEALDAQVYVLQTRLSVYGADDAYPYDPEKEDEGVRENVNCAAREAAQWLHGENEQEQPSKSWQELLEL